MSAPGSIPVAVTGFGSVGRGLARILVDYPEIPIIITAAVDRSGYALDPSGLDPTGLLAAKWAGSLASHMNGRSGRFGMKALRESQAKVLIEASSTNFVDGEPGSTYARMALLAKVSVVLASKGPLVVHWDSLHELAETTGCMIGISATHGAPVPAVDFGRVALRGNRLRGIHALLNSTTGLILEAMENGASFEESVSTARGGGVAETDLSLDTEGWDAAAKCVILARSLFAARMTLEDVERKGIAQLTPREVREAADARTPIKLVADIGQRDGRVKASVWPQRLMPDDPLAGLRHGALGVVYDAAPVGPLFVAAYGKGGIPTAAAVIRDVLTIAG